MKQRGLSLIEIMLVLVVASGFFTVLAYAYQSSKTQSNALLAGASIVETSERVRRYLEDNQQIMYSSKAYPRGLYPDNLEFDTATNQVPLAGDGHYRVNSLNLSYVGESGYTKDDGFMIVAVVPTAQCVTVVNAMVDEFEVIRVNGVAVKPIGGELSSTLLAQSCALAAVNSSIQGIALT